MESASFCVDVVAFITSYILKREEHPLHFEMAINGSLRSSSYQINTATVYVSIESIVRKKGIDSLKWFRETQLILTRTPELKTSTKMTMKTTLKKIVVMMMKKKKKKRSLP